LCIVQKYENSPAALLIIYVHYDTHDLWHPLHLLSLWHAPLLPQTMAEWGGYFFFQLSKKVQYTPNYQCNGRVKHAWIAVKYRQSKFWMSLRQHSAEHRNSEIYAEYQILKIIFRTVTLQEKCTEHSSFTSFLYTVSVQNILWAKKTGKYSHKVRKTEKVWKFFFKPIYPNPFSSSNEYEKRDYLNELHTHYKGY
jgi:hypothetical protein